MLKIQLVKGYENNKYLLKIINLELETFNKSLAIIYKIDREINYYVLLLYDNLIGFLSYKQYDSKNIDIYNFIIKKEYQNQKLGQQLINQLLNYNIVLEVSSKNYQALNFYYKNNFKIIQELPNYYEGIMGYRMYREAK